jgi:PAS domain S-box-containing protein
MRPTVAKMLGVPVLLLALGVLGTLGVCWSLFGHQVEHEELADLLTRQRMLGGQLGLALAYAEPGQDDDRARVDVAVRAFETALLELEQSHVLTEHPPAPLLAALAHARRDWDGMRPLLAGVAATRGPAPEAQGLLAGLEARRGRLMDHLRTAGDTHRAHMAGARTSAAWTLALLAFAQLKLALVALWLLRRRVLARVARLEDTTGRLRAGESRARADLPGRDELATLGRSLDLLAEEQGRRLEQTESQRQQAEERFARVFQVSPLPIVVSTLTGGRILDLNPSAEEASGYRREELVGRRIWEVGAWADPLDARRLRDELLGSGGRIRQREAHFRRKDGTRYVGLASFVVVRLDGEECVVTMAQDVTEYRRLQDQLRQSAKMEAIGQLAGGVAHDFNNLLTVITHSTELLTRKHELPPRARELVEGVRRAAQRAAGLTRQLLAFSRKQTLTPEVLDANAVVEDTGRMLRRLIGEDIEMVTRLSPEAGCVRADRTQLEQVLLNLAVNARDAMPRGGQLTLRTARQDAQVLLEVTDTGVGMSPEVLAHIFEPFFTTKPQGQGTGLGLSTVYGIVQQSGGQVQVDSAPGRGTTFRVVLPRAGSVLAEAGPAQPAPARPASALPAGPQATAPSPRRTATEARATEARATEAGATQVRAPPAPRAAAEAAEHPAPTGPTLLLVEDDEDVRRMLSRLLLHEGYRVLVAADGVEAEALARRHAGDIALLITDLVMPRLGGGETAQRLRALRPGLRVLFMSGYPGGAEEVRGLDGGHGHFLPKPFSLDALVRGVREALGGPPPPEEPAAPPLH